MIRVWERYHTFPFTVRRPNPQMLIDVKGQVNSSCSRSHITYSFDLCQSGGQVNIRFKYDPKRLESLDQAKTLISESLEKYSTSEHYPSTAANWQSFLPLTNLITISVDDPNHHRGAGHRHDPQQQLFLSEHQSSPGFVSGPIVAGMWKVTLSLHSIITETCSYELQVWSEQEELNALGSL